MTPSEWTNSEWLEALKADRESAWAALRGRVVRGLLGYLHSNRLPVNARQPVRVQIAKEAPHHSASQCRPGALTISLQGLEPLGIGPLRRRHWWPQSYFGRRVAAVERQIARSGWLDPAGSGRFS